MTTKLRLQRETDSAQKSKARGSRSDEPEVHIIPFPAALAAARARLVGAKVSGGPFTTPMDDHPTGADYSRRGGVIARLHAGRSGGEVERTDELIRGIERTMDRMQNRLDRFAKDVEDTLKFPAPTDDPGPRAA